MLSAYRKILLMRIYGQRKNLMGLYCGGGDLYSGGKTLQFAILLFVIFSSIKNVFGHFSLRARCEICSKLTNNKDTRKRKVIYKVKNKDNVDVVLASLLLALSTITFHFLL